MAGVAERSGLEFILILNMYLLPFVPPEYESVLLGENFFGEGVVVVAIVHHGNDAGIEDHLRADYAGERVAVERGAFDADAELCCLRNGILLRVRAAADLVPLAGGDPQLFPQAPSELRAMGNAFRCPVVSRGELLFVLGDYCAHLAAQAGCSLGPRTRNFHEDLVKCRPVFSGS